MATDILGENNFLKKWKKPGLWDRGVASGGPGEKPEFRCRRLHQNFLLLMEDGRRC